MIVNEGGKKLPKLTTPGTSADLLTGKELIDQYGRKIEGSMPYLYMAHVHGNIHFNNDYGMVYADKLFDHKGYTTFSSLSSSRKITTDDCPNLLPENIVSGKTIFGVTGTAPVAKKFYYESIPIETNETTIEIPMGPIDMLWADFYLDSSSVSALLSSSTNGGTLIVRDDTNFYWGHIIYTVNDRTAVQLDDLNTKYSTIKNMTIIAIAGLSFGK